MENKIYFTLFYSFVIATAVFLQGCGDNSATSNSQTKSKIRNQPSLESPEDQFRRVRKSELDPRMIIGHVVMTVKRVNGNEVTYGGYYTLNFDERMGIIGNKAETFRFHALYRDGKFVGWNPDR